MGHDSAEQLLTGTSSGAGKKGVVHGDDLLYRFFQELIATEPDVAASITELLICSMAIWLPLSLYEVSPVLLPWVVRDPKCRGNKSKSLPDEWASPNGAGYLRDDNSLIKSIPRSLTVDGPPGSHLRGARMGREFVAAHVWRVVTHDELASRIPLLNSFVPNLAWLPAQVAKLTDIEGGVVQQALQTMSHRIYRTAPVAKHLRPVVEEAWGIIPPPSATTTPVDLERLNWFVPTKAFLQRFETRLQRVINALALLDLDEPLDHKVEASRYTVGLPEVSTDARRALNEFLERFAPLPA